MLLQILERVPQWVWVLLVILIWMGALQSRSRQMSLGRALALPIAMFIFSLVGVISSSAGSIGAMLTWGAAWGLTVLTCQKAGYPQGWRFDEKSKQILVPGSWIPLGLMMTIFVLKFAMGVLSGMKPQFATQTHVVLPVSAAYGFLSGMFFARGLAAYTAWRATFLPHQGFVS